MLNKVIIQGRLCSEPELRTTPSGVEVTSFRLACKKSYVAKGAEQETDFIPVTAWRKTAVFITDHFHKGQEVLIEGSLNQHKQKTKNGDQVDTVEVTAEAVFFTGTKDGGQQRQAAPKQEEFTEVENDDDLPFD